MHRPCVAVGCVKGGVHLHVAVAVKVHDHDHDYDYDYDYVPAASLEEELGQVARAVQRSVLRDSATTSC